MSNHQLHDAAVALMEQMRKTKDEGEAAETMKGYNERRKVLVAGTTRLRTSRAPKPTAWPKKRWPRWSRLRTGSRASFAASGISGLVKLSVSDIQEATK